MKLELRSPEPGFISGEVSFDGDDGIELKKVPETTLFNKLNKTTSPTLGLLPPAVRYISANRKLVIFERPPAYHRVEYIPAQRDEINTKSQLITFDIPCPWLIYVVYFSDDYIPVHIRVYTRATPIKHLGSRLGLFPMLNFYGNSQLCNPIFERMEDHVPSLANGINLAYNMVWNSGFNYDLTDALSLGNRGNVPTSGRNRLKNPYLTFDIYGDQVTRYLNAWSQLSFDHLLNNVSWIGLVPWWYLKDTSPLDVTVKNVIAMIEQDMEGEYPKNAQTFMVNLVNTISSI